MKPFIILVFLAGATNLILHMIKEMTQPGLFNDPSSIAIGLLVMAGVAQLIWGKD